MKNDIIELKIEAIGFEGISIAKLDGLVYFVKGAVPGDKVLAKIKSKRKKFVKTELLEIIENSNERREPLCTHFGVCGGCNWQNLIYDEQTNWKRTHIIDSFERIGKVQVDDYLQTLQSPNEFYYRNKMEFTFGANRWLTSEEINSQESIENKHFALGLHIPGRFDKILDINQCHIHPVEFNILLTKVREKALSLTLTAYTSQGFEGFLRNLVLRKSVTKNEIMCILITHLPKTEAENSFIEWFLNTIPQISDNIVSAIFAINATRSPVAVGEIQKIVGKDYITEKILDIDYKISPFSFFQTNSLQLETFISHILEFAEIKDNNIVWDLYCGAGSITLPAAKLCKQIHGFEFSESSIKDANINKELNSIQNVYFKQVDLHSKNIAEILEPISKPDIIILDPPRSGLHTNLLNYLCELKPEKIVYVSCNPATQARDLSILKEYYNITKVLPVDMFPQTYHIETIAQLIRKNND